MTFIIMIFWIYFVFAGIYSVDANGEYFRLLLNDTDLSNYDRNDLWEHLQDELELRDIKTVSVKKHPILIPPALVIPICLQGSKFMKAIEEVQTAGPGTECIPEDLACFLGCLTDNGDTDQIENLINSLDDESLVYKMQCGVRDCADWWQIFAPLNPMAIPCIEMGRCLLQVISQACKEPVTQLIKMALQ